MKLVASSTTPTSEQHRWIHDAGTEEPVTQDLCNRCCPDDAYGEADTDDGEALPQDEAPDVHGPCAQGKANPELASALSHAIGHDSVEPDGAQQQAECGNEREHGRRNLLLVRQVVEQVVHRSHVDDCQIAIQIAHGLPDRREEEARLAVHAHEDRHARAILLRKWQIERRLRPSSGGLLFTVCNDADHLDTCTIPVVPAEGPAHGRFVRPQALSHRFVDHGLEWPRQIARLERTTLTNGQA